MGGGGGDQLDENENEKVGKKWERSKGVLVMDAYLYLISTMGRV
jgi:hypothetical protein